MDELEDRIEVLTNGLRKLAEAGLVTSNNVSILADWMKALSERIERLEGGKVKLS